MANGENKDRGQGVQPPVEYRIRRDDAAAWRNVFLVLGACVGLLGFFFTFLNGINEAFDRKLQNERNERINQDNKIEIRLDRCCGRKP